MLPLICRVKTHPFFFSSQRYNPEPTHQFCFQQKVAFRTENWWNFTNLRRYDAHRTHYQPRSFTARKALHGFSCGLIDSYCLQQTDMVSYLDNNTTSAACARSPQNLLDVVERKRKAPHFYIIYCGPLSGTIQADIFMTFFISMDYTETVRNSP